MAPLFRADQVGSLIRPATLLEHRAAHDIYADDATLDEMEHISNAIRDVAKKQIELSVRPITTGEFERTTFFSGFFEKLEGMTTRQLRIPEELRPELPTVQILKKMGMEQIGGVVATGQIKHLSSAYLSSWEMLKQAIPQNLWKECKISIPALTWQHMQLAGGTAYDVGVYHSDKEYFLDLAAAMQTEFRILYEAGLRSIQVDDPHLTYFAMEGFREGLRGANVDPDELLDLYIWAQNKVLEGLPDDMHVGVHLCRGNMPGIAGMPEASYEMIAEKVFSALNYNTFYLEFDDERSGGFEPLRFLPKGKNVVLGLISTKHPELEDIGTLKSRVIMAAESIAAGQRRNVDDVLEDSLAVSPQCGFASHSRNRGVGSEQRMWEKLVLVRDLARSVWKDAK